MTSTFPAHIIDLLPGQPYPSATTYQGLRYPGEVIFSEQWNSSWGTFLRGHEFFRIVFLDTHQQVPSEDLQDSTIAVCVPSASGRREQERKRERLSLRVISRILEGHWDKRIDLFIKVIQTSDLSGLANVLNDQVEKFLRELVAQS